jgi:hypothetical protein
MPQAGQSLLLWRCLLHMQLAELEALATSKEFEPVPPACLLQGEVDGASAAVDAAHAAWQRQSAVLAAAEGDLAAARAALHDAEVHSQVA